MPRKRNGLSKVHTGQVQQKPLSTFKGNFGKTYHHPYVDAVLADNPIAYWRMNERADAQIVKDYSTWGRHLSVRGPVVKEATGPLTYDSQGMTWDGSAVPFLGGSMSGNPTAISAVSVECWIKTTDAVLATGDATNGRYPVSVINTAAQTLISPSVTPTSVRFQVANAAVNAMTFTHGLGDGSWHQLVLTWETVGELVSCYVDGALKATATNAGSTTIATTMLAVGVGQEQDSVGGGFDATQAWSGSIAEMSFYTTQLKLDQVEAHYRAASKPPFIS